MNMNTVSGGGGNLFFTRESRNADYATTKQAVLREVSTCEGGEAPVSKENVKKQIIAPILAIYAGKTVFGGSHSLLAIKALRNEILDKLSDIKSDVSVSCLENKKAIIEGLVESLDSKQWLRLTPAETNNALAIQAEIEKAIKDTPSVGSALPGAMADGGASELAPFSTFGVSAIPMPEGTSVSGGGGGGHSLRFKDDSKVKAAKAACAEGAGFEYWGYQEIPVQKETDYSFVSSGIRDFLTHPDNVARGIENVALALYILATIPEPSLQGDLGVFLGQAMSGPEVDISFGQELVHLFNGTELGGMLFGEDAKFDIKDTVARKLYDDFKSGVRPALSDANRQLLTDVGYGDLLASYGSAVASSRTVSGIEMASIIPSIAGRNPPRGGEETASVMLDKLRQRITDINSDPKLDDHEKYSKIHDAIKPLLEGSLENKTRLVGVMRDFPEINREFEDWVLIVNDDLKTELKTEFEKINKSKEMSNSDKAYDKSLFVSTLLSQGVDRDVLLACLKKLPFVLKEGLDQTIQGLSTLDKPPVSGGGGGGGGIPLDSKTDSARGGSLPAEAVQDKLRTQFEEINKSAKNRGEKFEAKNSLVDILESEILDSSVLFTLLENLGAEYTIGLEYRIEQLSRDHKPQVGASVSGGGGGGNPLHFQSAGGAEETAAARPLSVSPAGSRFANAVGGAALSRVAASEGGGLSSVGQKVKAFFSGTEQIRPGRGGFMSFGEILDKKYDWESGHTFIQWMLPTTEGSAANPDAPVLTENDVSLLKADPEFRRNAIASAQRMLRHSGSVDWLKDHNNLRLIRLGYFIYNMELKDDLGDRFMTDLKDKLGQINTHLNDKPGAANSGRFRALTGLIVALN